MADLCKAAKELVDQFTSFEISHIVRVQTTDSLWFSFSEALYDVKITEKLLNSVSGLWLGVSFYP